MGAEINGNEHKIADKAAVSFYKPPSNLDTAETRLKQLIEQKYNINLGNHFCFSITNIFQLTIVPSTAGVATTTRNSGRPLQISLASITIALQMLVFTLVYCFSSCFL